MPGPARDGRVKLLDFGVAKLSEQEPRAESQTHTVDETRVDVGHRLAIVRPFEGDYYTQVKKETEVYVE